MREKILLIIKKVSKPSNLLLIILALGLFFRLFKPAQLFLYSHDQDLAGWVIKDVVVNKHIRLIGQETSTKGIFIGPLFYYMLIPFYFIFGMDPLGGVFMVSLLGLFTIISFYFIFSKIFDERSGLIAAFIYAVSFYLIFNDREVVPTMPVITWSVWYLYSLFLLLKGNQKFAYILLGILLGLVWHINVALALLFILVVIAQILSKRKVILKNLFSGLVALFATSLPLIAFEFRHGFIQSRSFLLSLTQDQADIWSGYKKLERVILLLSRNTSGLLWGALPKLPIGIGLITLSILFLYLALKKIISKNLSILFTSWILLYVVFFSIYSKQVSEYYLNGMMVVWIVVITLFLSSLFERKSTIFWGYVLLVTFFIVNVHRFFNLNINRSGYVERNAIISEIKSDAQTKGFPCVAISYITKPGYDLGYRYLFYFQNLKTKHPSSNAPVYTIVFPLNDKLFPTHKNFGAIGLIYPDYVKYTKEGIQESCVGDNYNLTEPIFGYTQ